MISFLKLITANTILSGFFTAIWLYFFVYLCNEKYLDKKILFGLPTGAFLAIIFVLFKSRPDFDLALAVYLLVFVFISALVACIISDIVEMTVPRICSIWLTPFWLFFAKLNLLPVDFFTSLQGASFGFLMPWFIANLYKKISGKDGLGFGDIELLTMVGAFIGSAGVIATFYFASISCLLFSSILFLINKNYTTFNTPIPFAPFLSFAALLCLFIY